MVYAFPIHILNGISFSWGDRIWQNFVASLSVFYYEIFASSLIFIVYLLKIINSCILVFLIQLTYNPVAVSFKCHFNRYFLFISSDLSSFFLSFLSTLELSSFKISIGFLGIAFSLVIAIYILILHNISWISIIQFSL